MGTVNGTKYLVPPVHMGLPASQWRQEKNTDMAGTAEATPTGPTVMLDPAGNPMQIVFTPLVNCWWHVESSMIWRNANANWAIELVALTLTPNDVEGKFSSEGRVDCHDGTSPMKWSGLTILTDWKLQAGTAYTCKLEIISAQIAWLTYYRHHPYLTMKGRTYGHGSF